MWGLLTISYHLPSLVAIGAVEVQIFFFFHFSCDHVIKRLHNLEAGVPPLQVTTLSSLVATDIAEMQI